MNWLRRLCGKVSKIAHGRIYSPMAVSAGGSQDSTRNNPQM
jgi:hypothetical protein